MVLSGWWVALVFPKIADNLNGPLMQGCLSARGERILFLDADGATEIRDMHRLEKALDGVTSEPNVAAVVVGSRAHLQKEAVAKV